MEQRETTVGPIVAWVLQRAGSEAWTHGIKTKKHYPVYVIAVDRLGPPDKNKKHYPVYAIAVDSLGPPDTGVDSLCHNIPIRRLFGSSLNVV